MYVMLQTEGIGAIVCGRAEKVEQRLPYQFFFEVVVWSKIFICFSKISWRPELQQNAEGQPSRVTACHLFFQLVCLVL